ncbi:GNAT family N-acetyltransferase [Corticicoccus populi]|uniref:GNAT family N-acetyltransferase n=1 Tax=Corticicoccus populi TaxID=1812821 RepID=A0ABW5WWZ2_9STAP
MGVIIRPVQIRDAENVLIHLEKCMDTYREQLMTEADELTLTTAEEEKVIMDISESDLFLVAESEGEIIGTLTMSGLKRRKVSHVAVFGMAVQKEYTGGGTGGRLMEYMIDFVSNHKTLCKIELEVFERNQRAVSFYQNFGFKEEGRLKNHVKMDDMFQDLLVMGRYLN